ncbi:PREDICTED: myosin-7-like isoform X16 [Lupinus angustifolius]|uniref:myosin-7-like isoform X16 n=1 Tax=Lupinus angustifolius TaxID=3871 RepID=UPI00092F1E58|nr:PREDICTED: myosin-7-like isoform X16 [Lupinus angustifolius]
MAGQLSFVVGSHIWIEDFDEAWKDVEILESNDQEITVSSESGTKVISKSSNIYPKDPEFPPDGVDDMTRLAYLHEPGVLQNLQVRYDVNEIYTYTGNILIAVNPFRRLPHLYANETMARYKGAGIGEHSPHPFAIADSAYRRMINDGASQAILVSGESGAGKTESTKMLMHYLAYMGGRAVTEGRSVEQQVLESNPVLEAFGNAKTVRNNNSSRFGKFVEIQFDQKGRISGAAIRTYLLERSRVCQVSDPERNYHCFYMLCAAPKEDVNRFKLGNPRQFHYLNQSNCYELDALDDSKEYLATRRAMDVVGISSDEQDAIFRIVAAVLHLGNIEFVKGVDDGTDSSQPKDDQSRFHLKTAAELLMCDEQSLEDSFCKRVMVTRGEAITRSLDPNSAALSRDALAKIVYSRLFDWIVDKINNSIGQDPNSKNLIGVLDIYGFESFKTNSFEQFCINLTNEKLQQHFNQHVFKMEQEEYTKEEIDWSYIEFVDNQDVLDLIEKIGQTKVFLRAGQMAELDACRAEVLGRSATVIQRNGRTYICRKHYVLFRLSTIELQRVARGQLARYRYEYMRREAASLKIQKQCRMYISRTAYKTIYVSAVHIQAGMRGMTARNDLRFRKRTQAAIVIQSHCRSYLARTRFRRLKKATIAVQCSWRRTIARRELRKLRMAAREAKALEAAKVNLEKQVEELTSCLETEKRMREAKTQENEKLQSSLHEIELQFQEAKAMLVQEREAAKKAAEHIQQFAVNAVDNELLNKLTEENEQLKEQVSSFEKKTNEIPVNVVDNELLNKLTAENEQLKELVNSFEKKTTNEIPVNVVDNELLNKLTAENEQLKELVSSLEKKSTHEFSVNVTDNELVNKLTAENEQLKELVNSFEKKTTDEFSVNVTDNELINKLSAENEQLKERVNSFEKKTTHEFSVNVPDNELINKLSAENEQLKEMVNSLEKKTKLELPVNISENELISKLSSENEHFKDLVNSLEKKIDETERKYQESNKLSDDRMTQIMETETRMIDLKTSMQRLEEKLSDMETENQVLRQQTLLSSSSRRMSGKFSPAAVPPLENGHQAPPSSTLAKPFGSESMRRSQMERQHESVDALFKCVAKELGFSEGKPVAAFTIYNCLLHWKAFEAEKTSIFDRLIQLIGSAIEDQDNNDNIAYWLSNTSALLFHLQRCLRVPTTKKPPTPTSFFGRMTQGFRSSNSLSSSAFDVVHQVDAKYPALLFKQQLAAYVEKIYGIIKENLKKDLLPLLSSCTKAHKTTNDNNQPDVSWLSIIECLNKFLKILKENYVHPVLVQKIFNQIFQYINVEIFNNLLLHQECCTFINGEHVKAGLAELELWCSEATEEYVGSPLDELKHATQAIRFLVVRQKDGLSYDDLTNDLCPVLSAHQLYRICTLYQDDSDTMQSVSSDVTTSLKFLMSDDEENDSKSFLLEDNSSIPIIVEEVSSSIKEKTIPKVKPPSELLENPAFQFLHDYS